MRYLFLILLAVAAIPARSAEPPVPLPVVILPAAPTPPVPPPPTAITTLAVDQLYVFRCASDCAVTVVPDDVVTITAETGPIKVRGKFCDGSGKYQCRTYAEKYVWLVEPVVSGKVTVIVTPLGGKASTVISLTVGDVPPPVPPTPPVPTDPLTKSLQEAYAAETDPMKATKTSQLADNLASVPAIRTTGIVTKLSELQRAFQASDDIICGKGGMPILRKAISVYIAGKMPATDQAMTDQLWLTAADAYGAVSKALKAVK